MVTFSEHVVTLLSTWSLLLGTRSLLVGTWLSAQWLGSNLAPCKGGGGLVWTFDVDGAKGMLDSYRGTDLWNVIRCPSRGTDIHVVRALNSDRYGY